MSTSVTLTGESLTVEDLVAVARSHARVEVTQEAADRADESRKAVEAALRDGATVYGVNTGFGKLANVRIPPDQLAQLQRNLIVSHVSGTGAPLPIDVVRGLMLLRANVLLKPTSGARSLVAARLVDMLNAGIHPIVPEQGSVGASGDLAPLAHVAYGLMGEGSVQVRRAPGGTGADGGTGIPLEPAGEALRAAGIAPVAFEAKEGLSFINGTQAQTSILALLVHDARRLAQWAHGAAAMSLEALRGTPVPFDQRIHEVRPHEGQRNSAALMRDLLADSEIRESHRHEDPRIQDAYSLRCTPQILGPVLEAIDHAASTVAVELNAATDNPLVFEGELLSGGNFHGQPIAMALDILTIALATLAGVAERRIDRLVNPDLSQGLPPFLAGRPGVESGYMMVQVTAAALAAECRSLCMPASVLSIPTDGNQEDHVPMGMAAAFKARRVFENAQRVVAAELLTAAQGLEYLRPLRPGRGVEQLYHRVRTLVPPLEGDRPITPDLERLAALIHQEALA